MHSHAKKITIATIFSIDILFLVFFYLFGAQGLPVLLKLHKERSYLTNEIELLQREIEQLQRDIDDWHHYQFYKERIAREELQMAVPDETVFYLIHEKE